MEMNCRFAKNQLLITGVKRGRLSSAPEDRESRGDTSDICRSRDWFEGSRIAKNGNGGRFGLGGRQEREKEGFNLG